MSGVHETETWGDLLQALQKLTPEQLAQPAQAVRHGSSDDHVHEGLPTICLGTVDALQLRYFRSMLDNRRHGEQVVLFLDGNPYGEDGVAAYKMEEDEAGNVIEKPLYRPDHDDGADWRGPAQAIYDAQEKAKA